MDFTVDVVPHDALSGLDIAALGRFFDNEYLDHFGPWSPELPYGYAPHDTHMIARSAGGVIGHVGWQRRLIAVGETEVTVAGVGGVLVSAAARGHGVGRQVMRATRESFADAGDIDFGFLGCREDVVEFYVSCGWLRIEAVERSSDRDGRPQRYEAGPPMLVFPVNRQAASWPRGTVDLRGRAW